MDALALLKQDHDKLRDLFDAVTRTFNPKLHRLLFGQIRSDLLNHSEIEETIFYPALENFGDLTLQIKNNTYEHNNLRSLLDEISNLSEEREEWQTKLKTLIQYAEHHMQIEEDELFPKVEKLMSYADRERP